MSLLGSVAKFVAQELTRPCLEKIGEHLGDAIGTVLGKRIDPNHGSQTEETEEENDESTHPSED